MSDILVLYEGGALCLPDRLIECPYPDVETNPNLVLYLKTDPFFYTGNKPVIAFNEKNSPFNPCCRIRKDSGYHSSRAPIHN